MLTVSSDLYHDGVRYWAEDPVYGGFVLVQADDLPTYSDANSDEFMYDADLNTLLRRLSTVMVSWIIDPIQTPRRRRTPPAMAGA